MYYSEGCLLHWPLRKKKFLLFSRRNNLRLQFQTLLLVLGKRKPPCANEIFGRASGSSPRQAKSSWIPRFVLLLHRKRASRFSDPMAARKKRAATRSAPEDTRSVRLHLEPENPQEHRSSFQKDRDRVLYSAYFRRLALITQVVSPQEGFWVHNRLTHVLKVAQVGRRLAERLAGSSDSELARKLGGLDADVVETACLAHDLGHPPFGHVAEEVLDKLAREEKPNLADGFEGNAQSFRVVAELESKSSHFRGLNLTRASLNAILKYPWHRSTDGGKRAMKWGAYHSEKKTFDFARNGDSSGGKSLEADLMDWADDIAYSVHDLEDFYLMRKIPLDQLSRDQDEQEEFLSAAMQRLGIAEGSAMDLYRKTAADFFSSIPIAEAFSGSPRELVGIRTYSSYQINQLICATSLSEGGLKIPEEYRRLVALLKQLTWHYVIEDESLATQQQGQERIVRKLYEIFREAQPKLFPPEFRDRASETKSGSAERVRLVLDMICSFTEQQCVLLFHRLTGVALGSFAQIRG